MNEATLKKLEEIRTRLEESEPAAVKKLSVEKSGGKLVLNVNGYRYALSEPNAKTLISMLQRQLKEDREDLRGPGRVRFRRS